MSGRVPKFRSLFVMLVAVLAPQTRAKSDQLLNHWTIGGSIDFKIESILGWSEVPQILFVPVAKREHHVVLIGKASASITRVSRDKRGTEVVSMAAVFDTRETPKSNNRISS